MKKPDRKISILLPEDIASVNKGEAGILYGMLESFAVLGEFELTVLSTCRDDIVNYNIAGCRVVPAPRYSDCSLLRRFQLIKAFLSLSSLSFFQVLFGRYLSEKLFSNPYFRAFISSDIIIIGHDNVFGFVAPNVMYFFPIVLYARLNRKKLVSYGATVGPFVRGSAVQRGISKRLILDKIDLFTLRDRMSQDYLKALGVKHPRIELTADLAFLLKPAEERDVALFMSSKGLKPSNGLVGITSCRFLAEQIRSLDGKYYSSFDERYDAYTSLISEIADLLIHDYGVRVLLIAHVTGPSKKADDRPVNEDIMKKIKYREAVVIINEDLSAPLLKGIIGRTGLMIGARTHSIIAASSFGVPVVGFTDEHRYKTNGIIGDQLGQGRYLIDLTASSADAVKSIIREAYEKREETRRDIAARLPGINSSVSRNGELLLELLSE